jgi:hypothetical protein
MRFFFHTLRIVVIFAFLAGFATHRTAANTKEGTDISLVRASLTFVGEEIGDWAGYFASSAGDVNGDGFHDILIGAPKAGYVPGFEAGQGKAYLVLGRPRLEFPSTPISMKAPGASFLGCRQGSMSGRQVQTAGDVNGDGFDDFLISGWQCGTNLRGEAYLFLGKSYIDWGIDFPMEQADAVFKGENDFDYASYYSSTAGDVNGDGYDDFLITATRNDEGGMDSGQVYLILGRPEADWGQNFSLALADASFHGEGVEDHLGRSTACAGDVNNDGFDDFMIGAIDSDDGGENAGEVYLFLGSRVIRWGRDTPVSQASASFIGEVAGDELGRRVAGAGDVNGDGFADMIFGAAANDQVATYAGKTYLILGRAAADWGMNFGLGNADAAFLGEVRLDESGRRLDGVGDVNGDGLSDFLIGAPHNSRAGRAVGSAYLIFGRRNADWGSGFPLARADRIYTGKPEIGRAGYDVAGVGDFDGDGEADFLISAFGGRIEPLTTPGEVYLLVGEKPTYLPIIGRFENRVHRDEEGNDR